MRQDSYNVPMKRHHLLLVGIGDGHAGSAQRRGVGGTAA